jgi:Cu(I)/Ag(I) efflux system membrane fusion protein
MNTRTILLTATVACIIAASFAAGYIIRGRAPAIDESEEQAKTDEIAFWTCSMDLGRYPGPGKCPKCGMDLIPVMKGEGDDGPNLKLSERARKLAEIEVVPVERRFVSVEVRMVGKIQYDETRLGYVTAWVPGRLDRLYVDFTGAAVNKDDEMVYIYSPDLFTAQRELIDAIKAAEEIEESDLPSMKETAALFVDAVREKLRLWGLTKKQIAEIERKKKPSDHMTIYAPMGGIVIHKNALEGMYVDTGTRIYTIADLSKVWVVLDAYETDLTWLKYAQEVEFVTEAYPGEVFRGQVSFIDPFLSAEKRAVNIRVNAPNLDARLKPDMFVHGIVRAKLTADGKVVAPQLAGKWISPVHPEIVKDDPGTCDVCGTPLVRAEALGYAGDDAQPPLVIPATAPLITGTRAVVYVQVEEGEYEFRQVTLGPRAGDYYVVKQGMEEGELVVIKGNFVIDAERQIRAKPSMMSPEGGAPPMHHHGGPHKTGGEAPTRMLETPPEFKKQLDGAFAKYFDIQQALSKDKLDAARKATGGLLATFDAVDMKLLEGEAHNAWMKELDGLIKSAKAMAAAKDIEKLRAGFATLSESMMVIAKRFGTSGGQPILRFRCPMAFDNRGADWLQNKPGTENPYFGSKMFKCGDQVETIHSGPAEEEPTENE